MKQKISGIKIIKPKPKFNWPKPNLKVLKFFLGLSLVLAVIAGVLYFTGFLKTFSLALKIQEEQRRSVDDQEALKQLQKIMELPKDVTPDIGLINDIDKLKKEDQELFSNAKNGDRVFIYPNMVIIFDPKANKIMNIGQSQQQAEVVPVAVYNGTADPQKMADFKKKLTSTFNNAVVSIEGQAQDTNYEKTLVIDLTGDNPDMPTIAKALGVEISELPAGETAPTSTTLLFIVGQD